MTRSVVFAPGEFYHLYNRGTEKRRIFTNTYDYERFLALLYLSNSTNPVHLQVQGRTLKEVLANNNDRDSILVEIGAYCLMPNHFHLIVKECVDGGVSKFMQKLSNGYTGYFNARNERSGALFQGKFKAQHADSDRYLSYLVSYVHLNPIKLIEPHWKEVGIKNMPKAEEYLEQFRYSSFRDYIGHTRMENVIISKDSLPKYCESVGEFRSAVREWLEYSHPIEVEP